MIVGNAEMRAGKNRLRMKMNIINDETGVSNVVGAILIMGFLLSIFSVMYAYYVPDKGYNLEAENIKEIKHQFSSFTGDLSSSISQNDIGAISTMDFNLGTEGYILATDLKSYGDIQFSPNEYQFNLRSSNGTINLTSSGSISYQSRNMYYDNSNIHYQWGMTSVITTNAEGIITDIPFNIEYHDDLLYINVVMIDLVGDGSSTSGIGSTNIKGTLNMVWNSNLNQTEENITITLNNADDLQITFYRFYKLNIVYASVGVSLVI